MRKLIDSKEIDPATWNDWINKCQGASLYSNYEYLNIVTEGRWKAVFDQNIAWPLPYKIKYGLLTFYRPPFCQQLGVYNQQSKPIDFLEIIKHLPWYTFRFQATFNAQTDWKNKPKQFKSRKNYYTIIAQREKYSESTRRKINNASSHGLICIEEKDFGRFNEFLCKETRSNTFLDDNHWKILLKLFKAKQFKTKILKVVLGQNIYAAAFFVIYNDVAYYLISGFNENYKKYNAISFLFHNALGGALGLIGKLDFEGSDIPGVEKLFQKFATHKEYYTECLEYYPRFKNYKP